MTKITLSTVASGFLSNEALTANFTAISDTLNNKVLYRNNPVGEPNVMQQDLDMNGHYILNQVADSGANFIWKGNWVVGVAYKQNNLVFVTSGSYSGYTMICLLDHTSSGIFADEVSNSQWAIISRPGLGITWKFTWIPGQPYEVNDAVYISSGTYTGYSMICLTAHTSPGSFVISNWGILAKAGDNGVGSGDMLKSDNLSGMASQTTSRLNILAARSGANTDITSLASPDIGAATATTPATNDNSTLVATTAMVQAVAALNSGNPAGTVIMFSGTSPPTGYLACPLVPTNISRSTYVNLFNAIGTTWGVGDGSTTFGMPYFPANYSGVQANANVSQSTTGSVMAHNHHVPLPTYWAGGGSGGIWFFSGGANSPSGYSGNTDSQTPTGAAANFSAGIRVLYCVKY